MRYESKRLVGHITSDKAGIPSKGVGKEETQKVRIDPGKTRTVKLDLR